MSASTRQHWDKWPANKVILRVNDTQKISKEKSSSLYSSTKVCCNSKSPLTLCKIKTDKETNKKQFKECTKRHNEMVVEK